MRTLFNKTFLTTASALSIFGLLLTVPQTVSAQEMNEEVDSVEMMEEDEMEFDGVDQPVELEGEEGMTEETEVMTEDMDVDSDVDYEEDIDTDTDVDYEEDIDADTDYSQPTYSNSPRALW